MNAISLPFQNLAVAVIERALADVQTTSDSRHYWQKDIDSAKVFLNNSPSLGFYADIAGIRHDLEKAGYIKPMEDAINGN